MSVPVTTGNSVSKSLKPIKPCCRSKHIQDAPERATVSATWMSGKLHHTPNAPPGWCHAKLGFAVTVALPRQSISCSAMSHKVDVNPTKAAAKVRHDTIAKRDRSYSN